MPIHFTLSNAQFAADYLEKNYLLMRGALRDARFSLDDVDQVLHAIEPCAPFLKLHDGSGIVAEERFTEFYNDLGSTRRRINKPAFYGLLRGGATLILNRVDARHELLRSLCLDVSKLTGQHTLANGYLAFGQRPSFGKHWDCHDVFAMQLSGRKRWQLYRPTFELPLPHQTSKDHKQACPAEPVLDIILEQGDILYIPRGWWHCATPVGEPTFHVAVGVHPAAVRDYFSWLCEEKLPELLSCRRSLGFDGSAEALVRAATREVLDVFESPQYLDEYLRLIAESDRVQSPFKLGEALGAGAALAGDTMVRLNTVYPRHPAPPDGLRRVVINGAAIELAEDEGRVLARLAPLAGMRVDELQAGLGDVDVPQVLRRLMVRDVVQLRPATH